MIELAVNINWKIKKLLQFVAYLKIYPCPTSQALEDFLEYCCPA
jgi:hypothetical protein